MKQFLILFLQPLTLGLSLHNTTERERKGKGRERREEGGGGAGEEGGGGRGEGGGGKGEGGGAGGVGERKKSTKRSIYTRTLYAVN